MAAGITHVDFHPGIERDGVAAALRSLDRTTLFLTTKIEKPPLGLAAAAAAELVGTQLEADLKVLGVDSVDMLMLRDSPSCAVMQAQWAAMEAARASGKTRAIGVVNFCEGSLRCLLQTAEVKPAVNYIMQHVGMGPDALGLRAYGESRGVRTFAYGVIGEGVLGPSAELLASPTLTRIGAAHGGRAAEEVALRWALQGGRAVSVRPTADFGRGRNACTEAGCAKGLRQRAAALGWSIAAAEMAELDGLRSPSGNPTLFSSAGCPDSFFAAS